MRMSTWKEKNRSANVKKDADKTNKEKVNQPVKNKEEEGSNN